MMSNKLGAVVIAVCASVAAGCGPNATPQTPATATQSAPAGMEEVAPGAKRKILHKKGLEEVPGREAVVSYVEYAPGGKSGKHTHAGPELVYVMNGSVKIEAEGAEPRTISAGDTYFGKAKVVHNVSNESKTETAKFLSFLLNEEGQMLAIPVKEDAPPPAPKK